jgi:disulfide bond formation protein DsbB
MVELCGIILMLFLAFLFQILLYELPCPLCLLQRVGFLGVAFGFLLNLRFGARPSHYAIVLISALYTSFVALRQIGLHIIPGTGAYGSAFLGLHLYTWSFIFSMIVVVITTLILGIDRQYQKPHPSNIRWRYLTNILFAIVTLLAVTNLISVLLECGIGICPDNPVRYEFLLDQLKSKV